MDQTATASSRAIQFETVLTTSGSCRLHIPYEGRSLCGIEANYREKPLAVYPPSHRDWCRMCLNLWQHADRSMGDS
jgi:hypothetical protein